MDKILLFLESSTGNLILILIFFLGVIFFLRYCFGPGGKLREKSWDLQNSSNKESTLKMSENTLIRKSQLEELLKPEIEIFSNHARSFLNGEREHDSMHLVKLEHSLRVLSYSLEIALHEQDFMPEKKPHPISSPYSFEADKILVLAALYHDLGRFEQLKRFNTFIDSQSINHAALSAKLLQSEVFLKQQTPLEKNLIRWAIAVHSKVELPEKTPELILPVCKALRDADKLDIINIMQKELAPGHQAHRSIVLFRPDEPEKYNPLILQTVMNRQAARYDDMQYINDFRLILCGWFYNLNYPSSKRLLASTGHLANIIQGLPKTPEILKLRHMLEQDIKKWSIN